MRCCTCISKRGFTRCLLIKEGSQGTLQGGNILLLSLLIILFMASCGSKEKQSEIRVFSAASLNEVISVLADDFADANEYTVMLNFASSGTLARQIEMGAGADVFLSANKQWVDYLIAEGLLTKEDTHVIAANSLVLIGGAYMAEIELRDAVKQRFVMGDPASVPVGAYTKEAFTYFHLWNEKHGFLYGRDVKHVLKLVEMGEADYGIVYKTDALGNDKVKIIAQIPEEAHAAVNYYFCDLRRGKEHPVTSFLSFLSSKRKATVWTNVGFKTVQNGI